MALILAFVSDTVKHRLGFALFGIILCVVGLSMLISIHHDLHTGYAALFVSYPFVWLSCKTKHRIAHCSGRLFRYAHCCLLV